MKPLLLTLIGWMILTAKANCADIPGSSSQSRPSVKSVSAPSNSNNQNRKTSALPATQTPNNISTPSSIPNHPSQVGSSKLINTDKAVLAGNKVFIPKSLIPQRSGMIQPVGPMFKDARNRGSSSAGVLGGSFKNKMAPVINGTGMNHKPL